MFMHTPIEKKFNEYTGNIHDILSHDASYLSEPAFLNQLLDRVEFMKRNFTLLNSEKEDVFIYQDYLARLADYAQGTLEWVEKFQVTGPTGYSTMDTLKENLFLLSDLFTTSQNLIKSFYPVT